jgi:hypothetical protein
MPDGYLWDRYGSVARIEDNPAFFSDLQIPSIARRSIHFRVPVRYFGMPFSQIVRCGCSRGRCLLARDRIGFGNGVNRGRASRHDKQ